MKNVLIDIDIYILKNGHINIDIHKKSLINISINIFKKDHFDINIANILTINIDISLKKKTWKNSKIWWKMFDIHKKSLIDIGINIFKKDHFDINIDFKCQYINNWYIEQGYPPGWPKVNILFLLFFLKTQVLYRTHPCGFKGLNLNLNDLIQIKISNSKI